jgi:cytochrome c-type biogenesis protein CcmH/NrfF
MLEVCPSSGGAMLRDSIQAMAEAGMSADSIVERVIRQFGEEWRAEPVARGMGLWAWLLPPLMLIGGLGVVAAVLAHRRRNGGPEVSEAEPGPLVGPEDEARLKDAMKEMDEAEEPAF